MSNHTQNGIKVNTEKPLWFEGKEASFSIYRKNHNGFFYFHKPSISGFPSPCIGGFFFNGGKQMKVYKQNMKKALEEIISIVDSRRIPGEDKEASPYELLGYIYSTAERALGIDSHLNRGME